MSVYEKASRILNDNIQLGIHATLRSGRIAQAAWDDTLSGSQEEAWADVSNWTLGANPFVAQDSLMKAGASPGAGSGGTRKGQTIKSAENVRIQCIVSKLGNGGGGVIVGVSKDADLATPASGATNTYGLYFTGAKIQSWNQGTPTDINASIANGEYLVTVELDENYMSFVAALTTDSATEYRWRIARPAATDLIPYLFNSDAGTYPASAKTVKSWAMKKGQVSGRKGFGITNKGRTVVSTQVGNSKLKLEFPVGHDSRIPTPVIMAFHGNGSDENLFTDNAGQAVAGRAFIDAGFIVASACPSSGSTWGAQSSLDAYYALYQYMTSRFAIGPIVMYANSMGGIESLLCLNEDRIKGVVGWIGMAPTFDLANCYANGFGATIDTAYGITGTSPNTYAELTAGRDPALLAAERFRAIPMAIYAASDDVAVSKSANGDALFAKVNGVAKEVTNEAGITGGHSFSLTGYVASMVAFAKKCTGG